MNFTNIQVFNYKELNFSLSLNFLIIRALSPFITYLIKINSIKIIIENLSLLSSLFLRLISIFTLIFYINIIKINTFNIIKTKFYTTSFLNLKFNFFSLIVSRVITLFLIYNIFFYKLITNKILWLLKHLTFKVKNINLYMLIFII